MKTMTLYQCRACDLLTDRLPSFPPDGVTVCPACRATEGGWNEVEADDWGNPVDPNPKGLRLVPRLAPTCVVEGTTCHSTPMFDKSGALVEKCPKCGMNTHKD